MFNNSNYSEIHFDPLYFPLPEPNDIIQKLIFKVLLCYLGHESHRIHLENVDES